MLKLGFYEQGEGVVDGFDFWSNFIWIFPPPKNNRREEKKSSYRFYALALCFNSGQIENQTCPLIKHQTQPFNTYLILAEMITTSWSLRLW